jgi:hypothetical protein
MTPPRRENAPNADVTPIKSLSRDALSKIRRPSFLCPRILNNPLPGAPLPSHRRLAALNLEESVALDFGARAQDFLKRITPLSADLAGHGRTRNLALQKLHRICLAEVRTLKARYTWPPSNSPSPSTATRSAPWTPITWSCAQEKCVPVSASAISRWIQKKPRA